MEMSEREKYEKAIREAGFEPFRTLSESWVVYALKDGSYVKIRANVIKISRRLDNEEKMSFNLNANMTIGVISPGSLKGTPTLRPITPQELQAAVVDNDIEFSVVEEEWSKFELHDGTVISVKPVLISASRTGIYDPGGEPIYNVTHHLLVKASLPEELRKKGVVLRQFSGASQPTFIA